MTAYFSHYLNPLFLLLQTAQEAEKEKEDEDEYPHRREPNTP